MERRSRIQELICDRREASNQDLVFIFQTLPKRQQRREPGSVCKVNTQDPENFDEEVKSLVTAWLTLESLFILLLIQPGRRIPEVYYEEPLTDPRNQENEDP